MHDKLLVDRGVLEQALETLEYSIKPLCWCWAGCEECDPEKAPDTEKTVAAIRAALTQRPEPVQKPVAWIHGDEYGDACHWVGGRMPPAGTKLYAAPPQRPLLTDGEISQEVYRKWGMLPGANSVITEFARAIERRVRGE